MRILIFLFGFICFQSLAQTRKQPPVIYKTINDKTFLPGERIALGTLKTESVDRKYRKFRIFLNDSLYKFRDFTFAHPEMEYRIVVTWRQTGRKFPSETAAVTDSLIGYFQKPVSSGDNRQYLNSVYHTFRKGTDDVKVELEILSVGQSKVLSNLPENPFKEPANLVLYTKYKNVVIIDTANIPADHSVWVEGYRLNIKYQGKGKALVRLKSSPEVRTLHLKSGTRKSEVSHGVYVFKVEKLPVPKVFIDSTELKSGMTVAQLLGSAKIFNAYYTEDIRLDAAFEVSEIRYNIAGKTYSHTGNKLSQKVIKALEQAPAGSEISITKIAVNGSRRVVFKEPIKLTK